MKAAPVVALVALLTLVSGCGGGSPSAPAAGAELRGRTFESSAVTENGAPRALVPGTRVSLAFTDDGRLRAQAGCNTMSAPVTLAGNRLELGEFATTTMGCDAPRHDQDQWLADFLATKPTLAIDGANLTISSGSTEVTMLDRTVANPALPLEGTHWTVDTVVHGQAASSTPPGATATLDFKGDTVAVDTGCNTGSGSYQELGDKIRFGPIATTKKACEPEIMSLEQAVTTVLDGTVTYAIDADQLTLTHPSGTALRLRGQR